MLNKRTIYIHSNENKRDRLEHEIDHHTNDHKRIWMDSSMEETKRVNKSSYYNRPVNTSWWKEPSTTTIKPIHQSGILCSFMDLIE